MVKNITSLNKISQDNFHIKLCSKCQRIKKRNEKCNQNVQAQNELSCKDSVINYSIDQKNTQYEIYRTLPTAPSIYKSEKKISKKIKSVFMSNCLQNGSIKIGSGSYALVFKAYDKLNEKFVAIKVFSSEIIKQKKIQEQIETERNLLLQLQSPNIVKILDFFEDKKNYYLVLEYCEGNTLEKILKKNRLSEETGKMIFKQLAETVKYLHDRNIYHRDLKIENIIVCSNQVVKLIDFGFAIHMQPFQLIRNLCGTPSYMAPEIHQKIAYLGGPADVWALGVTLYKILTQKFPFTKFEKFSKQNYELPSYISSECKKLFSLIFCERTQRITVDNILKSKWLSQYLKNQL